MGKWEKVKLGNHISQLRGVSYRPDEVSNIETSIHMPIIRAHNIQMEGLNTNNLVFVDKNRIKEHQYIKQDDIIICASSGSKELVGKAAQAKKNMRASFGAFCKVVRAKDTINAKYLKHYFLSTEYRYVISHLSEGANINNLRSEHINELLIPLPPLDIQKKIAAALDTANALIEKRKEQIEKLDLLIKSQFIEMFGDPVTNPKGWERTPMGKYIALLTDFSANGSYEYLDSNIVMSNEPGYALMVRTTDLEKNDFEKDVKYIDIKAYEILKKSKLFGNEIIINKIGSAGKVYIMPVIGKPASLGRNAFMIRYKSDINIKFIYYLLVSRYGEREIQKHIRGAVTKTITKEAVKSIQILCPPLYLQTQFAEFVEKVEAQKTLLQKSLADMEQNYQSLLQKCFKGEIF
ncbi:restriction endonuclease subunit S [Phascolarctobacterium sp.]